MVTPFLKCLNYSDTSPPPAKALPPHLSPKAARAQDRVRVTNTKGDATRIRAAVRDRGPIRRKRARKTKRGRSHAAARKSEANLVGAATRKSGPNQIGAAVRKSGAGQRGEATQKSATSRIGEADRQKRATPEGLAILKGAATRDDAPKHR